MKTTLFVCLYSTFILVLQITNYSRPRKDLSGSKFCAFAPLLFSVPAALAGCGFHQCFFQFHWNWSASQVSAHAFCSTGCRGALVVVVALEGWHHQRSGHTWDFWFMSTWLCCRGVGWWLLCWWLCMLVQVQWDCYRQFGQAKNQGDVHHNHAQVCEATHSCDCSLFCISYQGWLLCSWLWV